MPFQGVNQVEIIGYLSADPDIHQTATGKFVANFTIPTSRKWGEKDVTEWHKIVAWGKVAEVVSRYLKKGSLIRVEGFLSTNAWEDKNGAKHYKTEIIANQITMLGNRQSSGGAAKQSEEDAPPHSDGDLPF